LRPEALQQVKITDVKTYLVGNPWKNWLFVRVETDEGIHGIGEGTLGHFSGTVATAIEENKALLVGRDVFRIESMITRWMREIFADGAQIKMCAISAVEIACWDIVGKAVGQPIYNLLGGCAEKRYALMPTAGIDVHEPLRPSLKRPRKLCGWDTPP
jgi:galactonate dehydratase